MVDYAGNSKDLWYFTSYGFPFFLHVISALLYVFHNIKIKLKWIETFISFQRTISYILFFQKLRLQNKNNNASQNMNIGYCTMNSEPSPTCMLDSKKHTHIHIVLHEGQSQLGIEYKTKEHLALFVFLTSLPYFIVNPSDCKSTSRFTLLLSNHYPLNTSGELGCHFGCPVPSYPWPSNLLSIPK